MSTYYKGIKLEQLYKDASFTHSGIVRDMSAENLESDINIDYTQKLLALDKTHLTLSQFERISAVSSVIGMNYQICNGGIEQYFFNGFDSAKRPYSIQDTERQDKAGQVTFLRELYDFGSALFLERSKENEKLKRVIDQLEKIHVVNEEVFETVYSEEDPLLWDEEVSEWIDNPAYEEPYEISLGYQDVLKQAECFDENYYEVSGYIEDLLEGYSQFLYKTIKEEIKKEPLSVLIENAKKELSYETDKSVQKERMR